MKNRCNSGKKKGRFTIERQQSFTNRFFHSSFIRPITLFCEKITHIYLSFLSSMKRLFYITKIFYWSNYSPLVKLNKWNQIQEFYITLTFLQFYAIHKHLRSKNTTELLRFRRFHTELPKFLSLKHFQSHKKSRRSL